LIDRHVATFGVVNDIEVDQMLKTTFGCHKVYRSTRHALYLYGASLMLDLITKDLNALLLSKPLEVAHDPSTCEGNIGARSRDDPRCTTV
jgi:hypothetical protein